MGAVFDAVREALHLEQPLALCTVVEGSGVGAKMAVSGDLNQPVVGSLGNSELDRVVTHDARGLLVQGLTELRRYGSRGETMEVDVAVFVKSFAPPPRLIIFGAIDFSRALCQLGKVLGYRVTVCDARSRFATPARFPDADEVAVEWPHRYLERTNVDKHTIIVVMSHDSKFDIPALMAAVRTLRLTSAQWGVAGLTPTGCNDSSRQAWARLILPGLARRWDLTLGLAPRRKRRCQSSQR